MPDVRVCPLTVWAWRLGALAPADLWQRYIDLGGSVGPGELGAAQDRDAVFMG
jgi:hypothetical protein